VEAAARSYLQAANKAAYEMKRVGEAEDSAATQLTERVQGMIPGGY